MEKILIVDDNEHSSEILEDVLSAWGYEIYKAYQGMEAFNFACKYNPDIILLDVMLPGMNGFEVCKKLKDNPSTQNIPIIMLTVLNDVEDRIRGFNVGADEFLSKPISYPELKNRIISLINYKNQIEKMEHCNRVVACLLEIMKIQDYDLYKHSCIVRDYCEKAARILSISEEEKERLLIGAYLHDIGKIFTNTCLNHGEVGEDIIAPLKMNAWLKRFIRNHHEKNNGQGFPDGLMEQQMSLELQILTTVNRFVELWQKSGDKEISMVSLEKETKECCWSIDVLYALKQVLEDENLIKSLDLYL